MSDMTVPTTASNFEERWVIVCVNPSNPDDKMEFPSLVEMNAKLFQLKAEVEAQAKRWAESEDLISHYKQQRDEAYNDCECHRLKAEVERLSSQFANSEWQPIETAPKDGQDILAYRHPHGAFLIPRYWGNDTYQMTHWMPLPELPAKEGKPSV